MSEERKVVLITGAVKNSGLCFAHKFAKEGYDVCVTSRDPEQAAKTAQALAQQYGVKTMGFGLDLTDVRDIRRVFAELYKAFGRLDVFVGNSVNQGLGAAAVDITEAEFDNVADVNIKGNFFCCQEAFKIMREQRSGSIILLGSVHAQGAVYGRATYAMSKGAIASLVRNLAFEFAEYGVRVNSVVPGAIRTDRWDSYSPEEVARRRGRWPLGLESSGEDIASAVYFLASDQCKTATGSEFVMDSGVLACLMGYAGQNH